MRNPLIPSSLTKEWCTFANPNLKNHGRLYKESCGGFPCGASVWYCRLQYRICSEFEGTQSLQSIYAPVGCGTE